MPGVWWAALAVAGEGRFAVGGQLETSSHGVLDLGWRDEQWSVQLFTDTIDARVRREGDRGRSNLGLRLGTFAAGMWITPWTAGAVDPARAQSVSYLGLDGEVQRYLPRGLYAGAIGFFRPHWFRPLPDAVVTVPLTWWGQLDGVVGWYRPTAQARLAAGVDATAPGRWSPHVRLEAGVEPDWTVAPIAHAWAGVARATDDITATRLGGLTPYHVPFSGASWAEFWVQDHVVARLGVQVATGPWRVRAQVDVGAWTPPAITLMPDPQPLQAIGAGLDVRWRTEAGWFAQATVAHSPTLPRADGVWPVPVWIVAGRDWTSLTAARPRLASMASLRSASGASLREDVSSPTSARPRLASMASLRSASGASLREDVSSLASRGSHRPR